MRVIYIIGLLVLVSSSARVCGQTSDIVKKPKYKRVSEAYGYLMGQEYSLGLIKYSFPQLALSVFKTQMSFNSTFGASKEGMKDYLMAQLGGESAFNSYVDTVNTEFKRLVGYQTFTEEIATAFISEVESRAKGNIPSPTLETLLSFEYFAQPHQEFFDGFTKVFKTKGHAKSKNTDWQIKVPKSWRAAEGERPNIIQKFTSEFGDGKQSIALMVKEAPKGYKFSAKEINELFTEKGIKEAVPEGARFISFTKMTIDRNVSGMVEIEQTLPQLDFEIKIRMVQFIFIRSNKMYFLQGAVVTEHTDRDLAPEMKKYLPLFKLVANSIVVNDQYK